MFGIHRVSGGAYLGGGHGRHWGRRRFGAPAGLCNGPAGFCNGPAGLRGRPGQRRGAVAQGRGGGPPLGRGGRLHDGTVQRMPHHSRLCGTNTAENKRGGGCGGRDVYTGHSQAPTVRGPWSPIGGHWRPLEGWRIDDSKFYGHMVIFSIGGQWHR
jgi:hypothetical protein